MAEAEETPKKKKRWEPPQPTPEEIAALEEQHEDILVMRGPDLAPWCIIVRRPTRNETIVYKQAGKKEGQNATVNEQFIRKIAVFPEVRSGDMDALVAKWPFAPDGIVQSRTFNDFLGVTADADLKG